MILSYQIVTLLYQPNKESVNRWEADPKIPTRTILVPVRQTMEWWVVYINTDGESPHLWEVLIDCIQFSKSVISRCRFSIISDR